MPDRETSWPKAPLTTRTSKQKGENDDPGDQASASLRRNERHKTLHFLANKLGLSVARRIAFAANIRCIGTFDLRRGTG